MNILLLIPFVSFFLSCGMGEPKFVRKQINNDDIMVKWYYHSYITNQSPDFVVVEKDGIKKEIYKATEVVLNVTLKEHNIILKLVKPSKGLVFTKKVDQEVFGYKIILDTTGTYDELRFRPDGVKESSFTPLRVFPERSTPLLVCS